MSGFIIFPALQFFYNWKKATSYPEKIFPDSVDFPRGWPKLREEKIKGQL